MVYSNKFVLCVLVDGQPQKELANGVVSLPFGASYALRLRNKNDRRAVVKIYIDGENVSGGGYVVPANDFIDIKRHHDKDRSFKFVSLDSAEAVEFGKNGPNDDKVKGTIEARFYLEKEVKQPVIIDHHHHHHHDHWYPKPVPYPVYPPYQPMWTYNHTTTYGSNASPRGMSAGGSIKCQSAGGGVYGSNSDCYGADQASVDFAANRSEKTLTCGLGVSSTPPPLQDGCTVEGHSTGQNFYAAYVDYEETYTSLKIFLQGHSSGEHVTTVTEPTPRKTNKDQRLDDLERENEELRRKLAEAENQRLKDKLKELQS